MVAIVRRRQAEQGLPTPFYRHHRLIVGADGKRFAKRDATGRLADLHAQGVTAAEIRAMLGLG